MSEMTLYVTIGAELLISTAALGTLGFVADRVLPGPASFVRGLLLTFILILAASLAGFVAVAGLPDHASMWAKQGVVLLVKTLLGAACGFALVRGLVTASRSAA